jgi:hypothetical protein
MGVALARGRSVESALETAVEAASKVAIGYGGGEAFEPVRR